MPLNIEKEVAALRRMTVGQLRDRYAEVHGEPTRSYHKQFLIRRIAWRLQALEEGDLSERARRRAAELANDADLRLRPPPRLRLAEADHGHVVTGTLNIPHDQRLPIPGTMITRDYRGRHIAVRVLEKGFEFEGEKYRSLTAIAKKVTGSHWSGWLFFGLTSLANTKRGEA